MNTSVPSNIFLLKRSIDLSLLRQGFHIPPEFHALAYAALGRELHHGESCDIQLMVEGKVFQVRMNNIDFDRKLISYIPRKTARKTGYRKVTLPMKEELYEALLEALKWKSDNKAREDYILPNVADR